MNYGNLELPKTELPVLLPTADFGHFGYRTPDPFIRHRFRETTRDKRPPHFQKTQ
jgi:hypothetical protein